MPDSTICMSFDFDALSVWFGYPNTSPAMLSRGEYGARVGVPRILTLLKAYNLPATFFIPGHTIDSYPDVVDTILKAGHEIAHHSYAHVDPGKQSPDEERRDMEQALEALNTVALKPRGYRSPSANFSQVTLALLDEYEFLYDSSLMGDDFRSYHPRLGDQVSQQSPLVRGQEARVWELPICFEFDDWVHFQFNFTPYRNGTSAPSKVLEIWTADFGWMHQHIDGGILTLAMHPQVIGRGHRIAMLEQFINHCLSQDGVTFKQMGDVAKNLQ